MLKTISLLLVLATAIGCGSRRSTPNAVGPHGVFKNAGLHDVTQREYRVDPPDEILIHAPDIKELDGQKQIVRPDGKISLDLTGEVLVAGKTPSEITEDLKVLVSRVYVKPDIRLDVLANSKFYYVFGPGSPGQGKHPYLGRVTLVSALATAGYSLDAWPQQIRLSRPSRHGEPNATVVVDFMKIVEYGDMTQNYLIEDGDVIEVPYNPLSAWNFGLQRLLGPIAGTANIVTTPVGVVTSARGTGL